MTRGVHKLAHGPSRQQMTPQPLERCSKSSNRWKQEAWGEVADQFGPLRNTGKAFGIWEAESQLGVSRARPLARRSFWSSSACASWPPTSPGFLPGLYSPMGRAEVCEPLSKKYSLSEQEGSIMGKTGAREAQLQILPGATIRLVLWSWARPFTCLRPSLVYNGNNLHPSTWFVGWKDKSVMENTWQIRGIQWLPANWIFSLGNGCQNTSWAGPPTSPESTPLHLLTLVTTSHFCWAGNQLALASTPCPTSSPWDQATTPTLPPTLIPQSKQPVYFKLWSLSPITILATFVRIELFSQPNILHTWTVGEDRSLGLELPGHRWGSTNID